MDCHPRPVHFEFRGISLAPFFLDSSLCSRLGPVEVVLRRLDRSRGRAEDAACLSADERCRATRFALARDRQRYVTCRAGLRRLLAVRLDCDPRAIEFSYGEFGKPALASAASALRFNVSHCGDIALFAFAQDFEVGVDLEALRTEEDADRIAREMFSPEEWLAYSEQVPRDRPRAFFDCWTRKEALAKALGSGLTSESDPSGWAIESFSPAPGFIAAVACRRLPASH